MTPLEAMAKARHDRLGKRNVVTWEKAHPGYRAGAMREAAADLIALAEQRMPARIVASGLAAEAERRSKNTGMAAAFQAMLQAIAGDARKQASGEGVAGMASSGTFFFV